MMSEGECASLSVNQTDNEARVRDGYVSRRARRPRRRSRRTRLDALGAHDLNLVVLGGFVPELLTGGEGSEAPAHLGTTDIDVHISLFADAETSVEPLDAALEAIGAEPDGGVDCWRWLIPSGGSRVRIEFLCDLEDQPEGGATGARAPRRAEPAA
jgi:hypothetical protein